MIRVLKCFVTPTLTYTAQDDESVLHIWIETQQVIDYVCCTCFLSTSNDSRIFLNALLRLTLTYIAQVDENVLHICIETQQVIDYIC